jgi:transposase
VVAEIGVDMSRFPTAGHLVSWAGVCPRSDQSAGKRRSTRVRKSGTWIKTTLVTAASLRRVQTSRLEPAQAVLTREIKGLQCTLHS